MKRITAILTLFALLLCSPAALANHKGIILAPNRQRPFTIGVSQFLATMPLDPARVYGDSAATIVGHLYEGLLTIGPDGEPRPDGAAASWILSEDRLTYTFTLRDGLTWSDGVPLTAGDFAYAWLRALDPVEVEASGFSLMFPIRGAREWALLDSSAPDFAARRAELKAKVGIRALDAKRLEVTLEQPTPHFLKLLALPTFLPVRRDMVEQHKSSYGRDTKLIGNGPFVLAGRNPHTLTLEKNPRYWNAGQVKLQTVVINVSPADEFAGLFAENQIDLYLEKGNASSSVREQPVYQTRIEPSVTFVALNLKRGALGNRHIRRALQFALDRSQLVSEAPLSEYIPATGLVPGEVHLGGKEFRKQAGDRLATAARSAEAKEELKLGLKELGISTLPAFNLRVATPENKLLGERVTALIAQVLPEVKIAVEQVDPRSNFIRQVDYDLTILTYTADSDDPASYFEPFQSDYPVNYTSYLSPGLDGLLAAANTARSEADREARLKEAETLLIEDAPILPLYHRTFGTVVRSNVKGVTFPAAGYDYDLKGAWMETERQAIFRLGAPEGVRLVAGQPFIPLAAAAREMGAAVKEHDSGLIGLTSGRTYTELQPGVIWAVIDGHLVKLSAAPAVIEGVLYVPLDLVREALGVTATSDKVNYSVTLKKEL